MSRFPSCVELAPCEALGSVHARPAARQQPLVDDRPIPVYSETDPAHLPWGDIGAEVVIESSGFFRDREGAAKHLEAGARKVIVSAPAKQPDVTVALGINFGNASVELYWIPLGAGGDSVRFNGRAFEALEAARRHRRRCDVYHVALVVELQLHGLVAARDSRGTDPGAPTAAARSRPGRDAGLEAARRRCAIGV